MNIRTLLEQYDLFQTKEQLISFIKILAFRGCFNLSLVTSLLEEGTPQQKTRAKKALDHWPKHLKANYPSIINDEELKNILHIEFENKDQFKQCLLSVIDLRMLRSTFDQEIKTTERPNTEMLLKRWNVVDAQDISEVKKDPTSSYYFFLQWAKSLALIDEIPIPQNGVDQFIIHGGLQRFVEERIDFLLRYLREQKISPSTKIKVNYHSGPRGVENKEEALAFILASDKFLNVPGKVGIIQQVLKDSEHSGIENPTLLQQELVVALGLDKWPEKTYGWNNKGPENYSSALKNWPVAMDMFEFILNNKIKKYPELKPLQEQIFLDVTIGHGVNGRLATTADVYHALVKKMREELDLSKPIALITDNISHDIIRQGKIGRNFLSKYIPKENIFLCGSGAQEFSIAAICDVMAKNIFYELNKKPEISSELQLSGVTSLGIYSSKKTPPPHSEKEIEASRKLNF